MIILACVLTVFSTLIAYTLYEAVSYGLHWHRQHQPTYDILSEADQIAAAVWLAHDELRDGLKVRR